MLTFIVPVKSKSVSSNWPSFCDLFENTLKSICNQSDLNFRVVVVCHDIPEIQFRHKHVKYIVADFEPPEISGNHPDLSLLQRRLDKGNKIKLGVAYANETYLTDYVMTVDSDDYISNQIAAYVNSSNEGVPGWYVKRGYLHFNSEHFLVTTKKFSYLCGSSLIFKPELVNSFFDKQEVKLYFNHQLTVLDSDIVLSILPFPGGIYNIGNGENLFMSFRNVKDLNNHKNWLSRQSLKRLKTKIQNYGLCFVGSRLRREFNFY